MTVNYAVYRQSAREQARIEDLLRILPPWRSTVLDIGARDGFISLLMTEHFKSVTALDVVKPRFQAPGIALVQGDVARLGFADDSFDVVCCLEVLEHLDPQLLPVACQELARVARHAVIIGVPYRQDLRIGRTTCGRCGQINPPWGHQNSFDEQKLERLFASLQPISTTYVGQTKERSSLFAAWLMNRAGNPWGTYEQEEPCIACEQTLVPSRRRGLWHRACAAAAHHINRAMMAGAEPKPLWIHCVFEKL